MKRIIVMIAMIILGIAIAGAVGSFEESAGIISENAAEQIETINSDWQD